MLSTIQALKCYFHFDKKYTHGQNKMQLVKIFALSFALKGLYKAIATVEIHVAWHLGMVSLYGADHVVAANVGRVSNSG